MIYLVDTIRGKLSNRTHIERTSNTHVVAICLVRKDTCVLRSVQYGRMEQIYHRPPQIPPTSVLEVKQKRADE
jgi:hypothetical protein